MPIPQKMKKSKKKFVRGNDLKLCYNDIKIDFENRSIKQPEIVIL